MSHPTTGGKLLTAPCQSANVPSEFSALVGTELDITATEEALDKLQWHEVVENVLPGTVLGAKHTTRWERQLR